MNDGLIYDWNQKGSPAAGRRRSCCNDETLRDGLQSPSVAAPTIDQKLRILHLLDRIGIDTADIGLPGAGPHVVKDVERLAREIVDVPPAKCRPTARRARVIADIQPIADIVQRTGLPIECCCFIGSSPIRRYAEDWTVDYLQRCTEEAVGFAVRQGLTVMYVTEDTTRSDPDTLRRLFSTAIRAGASRLCIADTVGHATPDGARAVVALRAGAGRGARRRRSASTGTATATATWGRSTASPRSRPAPRACTARCSGSASASATRRWIC